MIDKGEKLMSFTSKIMLILVIVVSAFGSIFLVKKYLIEPSDWVDHDTQLFRLDQQKTVLMNRIKNIAGSSHCKDNSQCHVVGLGSTKCDGYSDFLIYSTYDVKEKELLELVRKFNEADEKYNSISLRPTSCGEKARPVGCVNGGCEVL